MEEWVRVARVSDAGSTSFRAQILNVALAGRGGGRALQAKAPSWVSHPNIAKLVDAGVSSSGQPYLVLEYVDGEHIDLHSDQRKLDVDARIYLFLDVLLAVAHAHSNLIVHRDIKPSNVLIRKDGQVKLLDFGIAKLLQGEGETSEVTLLTVGDSGLMTPAFAAPEQVTGGAVTTATDVHALGVLTLCC
jgi:serine/threonine-protein kinase